MTQPWSYVQGADAEVEGPWIWLP